MLTSALVQEIDRLLREGRMSRRKIAVHLGVSRGIVNAIATGRRGLHGSDDVLRRPTHTPTSVATRCPRCGYRVYLPCIICRTRLNQAHRQPLAKKPPNVSRLPLTTNH